jgi:protein-tyrosine phosphatase
MPTSLRGLLRRIKHWPARVLHAHRRRTATEALRRLSPPASILLLCHGNICRSPYAEAVLRGRLADLGLADIGISSAGFIEPDRQSPPEALAVSLGHGYDLSGHRSSLVTSQALRESAVVVVMDSSQREHAFELGAPQDRLFLLGDFDPLPIERRTIPDPIDRPAEVFERVYGRIDRCVGEVALTIAAGRR